jgi:hypothetical protein
MMTVMDAIIGVFSSPYEVFERLKTAAFGEGTFA